MIAVTLCSILLQFHLSIDTRLLQHETARHRGVLPSSLPSFFSFFLSFFPSFFLSALSFCPVPSLSVRPVKSLWWGKKDKLKRGNCGSEETAGHALPGRPAAMEEEEERKGVRLETRRRNGKLQSSLKWPFGWSRGVWKEGHAPNEWQKKLAAALGGGGLIPTEWDESNGERHSI